MFIKIKSMGRTSKTYVISEKTTKEIIYGIINKSKLSNPENIVHIMNILNEGLTEAHVSFVLNSILSYKEIKTLEIGDIVKVKPPNYHAGSNFEWDVLIDKGLGTIDGYVYGRIKTDGSWSDGFDPYHIDMEVMLYYYDVENQVIKEESVKISTFDIELVDKKTIPFFNKVVQTELFSEINETDTNEISI